MFSVLGYCPRIANLKNISESSCSVNFSCLTSTSFSKLGLALPCPPPRKYLSLSVPGLPLSSSAPKETSLTSIQSCQMLAGQGACKHPFVGFLGDFRAPKKLENPGRPVNCTQDAAWHSEDAQRVQKLSPQQPGELTLDLRRPTVQCARAEAPGQVTSQDMRPHTGRAGAPGHAPSMSVSSAASSSHGSASACSRAASPKGSSSMAPAPARFRRRPAFTKSSSETRVQGGATQAVGRGFPLCPAHQPEPTGSRQLLGGSDFLLEPSFPQPPSCGCSGGP